MDDQMAKIPETGPKAKPLQRAASFRANGRIAPPPRHRAPTRRGPDAFEPADRSRLRLARA